MRLFSTWAAIGVAVASSACNWVSGGAKGSFERTLPVSGPVAVDVQTSSGDIEVRSADTDQVRIKAVLTVRDAFLDSRDSEDLARALEQNTPIERRGETIRIGAIADRRTRERVSIAYEIVVPSRARLHSETGSGGQRLRGVAGPIDARTGSGDIDIAETRSDVHAETGSGSIRVADARDGQVELSAGSGCISVGDIKGPLRVHTSSGEIVVAGEPVDRWQLQTASGSISARIPATAGFELAARTVSRLPRMFRNRCQKEED
jgi:DUF4097 and DUF4098 domain-containing protein YvlB